MNEFWKEARLKLFSYAVAALSALKRLRNKKTRGGRLWDFPFQGRPRVNPTVKRGIEEACATEYLVAGRRSTGTHLGNEDDTAGGNWLHTHCSHLYVPYVEMQDVLRRGPTSPTSAGRR